MKEMSSSIILTVAKCNFSLPLFFFFFGKLFQDSEDFLLKISFQIFMLDISRKCCVTNPGIQNWAFMIPTRSKYTINIYMHFFYSFEK